MPHSDYGSVNKDQGINKDQSQSLVWDNHAFIFSLRAMHVPLSHTSIQCHLSLNCITSCGCRGGIPRSDATAHPLWKKHVTFIKVKQAGRRAQEVRRRRPGLKGLGSACNYLSAFRESNNTSQGALGREYQAWHCVGCYALLLCCAG